MRLCLLLLLLMLLFILFFFAAAAPAFACISSQGHCLGSESEGRGGHLEAARATTMNAVNAACF